MVVKKIYGRECSTKSFQVFIFVQYIIQCYHSLLNLLFTGLNASTLHSHEKVVLLIILS